MARIEKKEQGYFLHLTPDEEQKIKLHTASEIEILEPKAGLWILVEKTNISGEYAAIPAKAKSTEEPIRIPLLAAFSGISKPITPLNPVTQTKENPLDEKLFRKLSDRKFLSDRIVGKFEKTIPPEELKRFQELLKEGVIETFKLNEKYKNPVYRLNEKKWGEKKSGTRASEPASPAGLLSKNGFLVLPTEEQARKAGQELEPRVKRGEVRGIKGFDGAVYFMENRVYSEMSHKAIEFFSARKNISIPDLAALLKTAPAGATVLCEFLKEDGILFEKNKGIFRIIE